MVSSSASWALSIYAIGVLLGRVFCGAALDRLPAHIVATIGLAAPGFGLLLIGFFPGNTELLYLGVLMLGLSMGAELDIAGYLVMRFFDLKVYSSAYSLIAIGTALSASLGSGILSAFLLVSDSFVPFLIATGIVTILGSSFFYRLKNVPTHNAIRHH